MSNIAKTKGLLADARQAVTDAEREYAEKPESLFRKIALRSAQHHLDDLQRELAFQLERHEAEIIEKRS